MKTILIIAGIFMVAYLCYRTYRVMTLNKGLEQQLANGAIILDVRTETEYSTGHIDGSVNISLGTLKTRYTELDSTKTYITCCSHGLRSVKAESILKERGFKNVFNGGALSDLEKFIKSK